MQERHGLRSPVAGRLLVVPCGRKVENLYAAISPGLVVNPARPADQVIGAPTQRTSQALIEQVIFNTSSVTSLDWVTYLVLRFKEDPKVTPIVLQRPDHGTHGGGEEPITAVFAAIANAFFDATGVRLRQTPMTPAIVRTALEAAGIAWSDWGRQLSDSRIRACPDGATMCSGDKRLYRAKMTPAFVHAGLGAAR